MEQPLLFNLSEKLKYSRKGEHVETATLEFRPPGMTSFKTLSRLQQYVVRCALSMSKIYKDKGDPNAEELPDIENITGEGGALGIFKRMDPGIIRLMLFSSDEVLFSDVADVFKKLAIETGTLDGETPLKEAHFNRISVADFTELVCEYCANFIFPSLF